MDKNKERRLKLFSIIILCSLLLNVFSTIILADNELAENNYVANDIDVENKDNNETIDDENEENNNIVEDDNIIEDNNIIENETVKKDNNVVDDKTLEDNNVVNEIEDVWENDNNTENDFSVLSSTNSSLGIKYRTHVQNEGWQNYVQDEQIAGTSGKSLRLEAIDMQLVNSKQNINLKYQVHVQNIGWQDWKKNGEMAGTSGKSFRLEAIRICLDSSDEYSVMYRVHVQNIGWQEWKTDGEIAGTSGQSLRLEAIQIKIVPKQKKGRIYVDTPVNGNTYYSSSNISVQGWKMANVSNSTIKAYIDDKEIEANKITYYNRTDVTNSILDYGTAAQNPKAGFKFNISSSNLSSGKHTIKIVAYSGNSVLATTSVNFYLDTQLHVTYRSHVQNVGWQGYVKDGQMAGTSGKSYRVEALNINLINAPSNAKILYRTHVQNIGWQQWKSNGELTGTSGQSLRIEALQIKLENMDEYTVEYQVHIQDIGWSGWYIDGETAGTVGQGKRIEALRIRIVSKYKHNYNGIDVSAYNGTINWGNVKRSGIDFAMIRVGYRGYGKAGNFREDANFRTNIKAANQLDLPVGIYFVTQAITEAEAIEEANWVLDKIKGYNVKYPIAIDIEEPGLESPFDIPRTQNLDKNTRTYLASVFCKTIQNAGYTPIIYTNLNWAYNYLNMTDLLQYDTWIARHRDINLGPGYKWDYSMWQYSSTGTVNGILGNVDLNICYKKY